MRRASERAAPRSVLIQFAQDPRFLMGPSGEVSQGSGGRSNHAPTLRFHARQRRDRGIILLQIHADCKKRMDAAWDDGLKELPGASSCRVPNPHFSPTHRGGCRSPPTLAPSLHFRARQFGVGRGSVPAPLKDRVLHSLRFSSLGPSVDLQRISRRETAGPSLLVRYPG